MTTAWRATGPYMASSALFSGIFAETRQFLNTYAQQRGAVDARVEATKQALVAGELPQRSYASRKSIVQRIQSRLTRWDPPAWVLDDLATFAREPSSLALKAALLMHVCRQDRLLYDLVTALVLPLWRNGPPYVDSAAVQRFLDDALPHHPEIEGWSRQTRTRLGSTTLTILRDYGLLQGKTRKQIVEPIVPDDVVLHVARLLRAEGIDAAELPTHPDWRLWLWDEARTRRQLAGLPTA